MYYDASRVLRDQDVQFEGYTYPWYFCPFEWAGVLHDPAGLREQRTLYRQWKDWYDGSEDWSTGRLKVVPKPQTKEEDKARRLLFVLLCQKNNAFFAHHCLHIVNKNKDKVLFDNWLYGQRIMQFAFAYQWWVLGVAVRLIVLKARQFGGSTWVQATAFWLGYWNENQSILTLTDAKKHSTSMMDMVAFFLTNIQSTLEEEEMAEVGNDSTALIRFGSDRGENTKTPGTINGRNRVKSKRRVLNSKLETVTAGSGTREMSTSHSFFHGSEVAFWNNAETQWLGVAQTVPLSNTRSIMVLESTANGWGNFFHRKWEESADQESTYLRIFVPWYTIPDYRTSLPGTRDDFIATMTDEEKKEQIAYDLVLEQLYWRRQCIKDQCLGDPMKFRQEFPATSDEAFLVTGSNTYAPEATKYYLQQTRVVKNDVVDNEVRWRGEFDLREDGTVAWYPRSDGPIRIYRMPEVGKSYGIGLDPSEGRSGTADHSAIECWSYEPREQCAVLDEIREPEFVCLQARCMQLVYGNAFLIPEANAIGAVAVMLLVQMQAWPMYRRESLDRATNVSSSTYGYYAAHGSKKAAVSGAKAIYNNKKAIFHNLKTVREFEHLKHNGERYCSDMAEVGDDDHDATIICWMGLDSKQFEVAKRPIPEGMVQVRQMLKSAEEARSEKRTSDIPGFFRYDEDEDQAFVHPVLGAM
jgi:hypothetical protein